MPKILSSKPWLLVVAFFAFFVAIWVAFIVFAVKHQPEQVPIVAPDQTQPAHADH